MKKEYIIIMMVLIMVGFCVFLDNGVEETEISYCGIPFNTCYNNNNHTGLCRVSWECENGVINILSSDEVMRK